jgi:cellulose synthase/poly-beta-1,6-N-acetylglucosamine synthase-like glycosyltransferase
LTTAHWIFWLSLAAVSYTCVGYPLLVWLTAKLFGRPVRKQSFTGSFTIVLAVHNEEHTIVGRLSELCRHIERTGLIGDIIVAADGCTDATVVRARTYEGIAPVRMLVLPENRGKAAALTEAAALATGEILLFADARQRWADDAIPELLANFADPDVGAVSGNLQLEQAPGVLAGVGLYWRFEKWLRKQESRVRAQIGVTGAICGVRRPLFSPIPHGTLLDDVYWPLRVAMAGHRVVHDESARAYDRLPEKSSAEFRRKVRTLAGNFQLASLVPASLLPWRNSVWLAWMSHKLMRLVLPWALLAMLISPIIIATPTSMTFFSVEAAAYGLALAGLWPKLGKSRLLGAAASFLILNAAAWVAFWIWAFGRTGSAWRNTEYRKPIGENLVRSKCPMS